MRGLMFTIACVCALSLCGCEEETQFKPYYVLTITARVVDEAGEPIQGIHVYPAGYTFPGREGYTDYRGEMGANTHIEPYRQVKIVFEDVDGEYNRGVWQSRTIDITSQIDPPQEADKWGYSGSCFLELGDVVLSPAAQ